MDIGYSFRISGQASYARKYNGNATDDVGRDTEKKFPNMGVPAFRTFLSVDRRIRGTGIFHGMRWGVGRPRSVPNARLRFVERQPTTYPYQASCSSYRYLPQFCTLYIYMARRAVVSLLHSICARVSKIGYCETCILWTDLPQSAEALRLQQMFCSRTNRVSLSVEFPTFTMNMCGQMKLLIRFDLTNSIDRFPSTCWLV
jgi:hypothetical protein